MPARKTEETKVENTQLQKNVRFYHQFMTTPKDAQKAFDNGRFSGTDINPMWRIKVLTEVFGPAGFGWWTQNIKYDFVEADLTRPNANNVVKKEVSVFCELELIVKDPETGEVSQPIYGVGGNTFIAEGKWGPRASDEAKKMAYTDALSIACKALGVGHDIWYSNDRTKYTMPNDNAPVKQDTTKPESKPVDNNKPADTAKQPEKPAEPPAEHTADTATLIDEIDKKLAEIGEHMSKEDKLAYAKEMIAPIVGSMNYKKCTDVTKLTELRNKLCA